MLKIVIRHVTATVTYELDTNDPSEAERYFKVAARDHAVTLKAIADGTAHGFLYTVVDTGVKA